MKMLVRMEKAHQDDYHAWCPSLPGCAVHAGSKEQTCQAMLEAVRCYLYSLDVSIPDDLTLDVRWVEDRQDVGPTVN